MVRDSIVSAEYVPYELRQMFGADEGYSTIDFTTPGVVKSVNPNMVDQLEIVPNSIHLKSGECPKHLNAAKDVSGLTTVQITPPAGASFLYKERDNYRVVSFTITGASCGTYVNGSWSSNKYLAPGQTVQIRVQKAEPIWGTDKWKLFAKDIELVTVQTNIETKPPTPTPGDGGDGDGGEEPSWVLPLVVIGGVVVSATVLILWKIDKLPSL